MKKRAMKKYIPRDTDYCYKSFKFNKCGIPIRTNYCKNLQFKGFETDYYIEDKNKEKPIKLPVYRCRYTNTEPLDDCKDCYVGIPEYPF
ncbi:hypothetical protein HYI19_18070 [Clostridium botulinum]|uniref:hypothetical protein n=1 Tax=Clostridium botulinum TaxID=1491 RepID=UPI001C9B4533|nr:hypothetical protein [Clostridium botulinum]MBY6846701.1 hypothetical protein [Clostridium botulinum]